MQKESERAMAIKVARKIKRTFVEPEQKTVEKTSKSEGSGR